MTLKMGKLTGFMNKSFYKSFLNKHVLSLIIFVLALVNYTVVLGQVIYKQNNRTVDLN